MAAILRADFEGAGEDMAFGQTICPIGQAAITAKPAHALILGTLLLLTRP